MKREEDIEIGKKAEWEVAYILLRRGRVINIHMPPGNFPYYDIQVTTEKNEQTYEVKVDRLWIKSTEVGIEYEKKWKPTGIAITKADYMVYKLGNSYWCANRPKLVSLLMKSQTKRDCVGWDDGTTRLWVIPEKDFYSVAYKLWDSYLELQS